MADENAKMIDGGFFDKLRMTAGFVCLIEAMLLY